MDPLTVAPVPPEARELYDLAVAASECVACRLYERRKHVVFGEGDARAILALVGEGPGENEDESGRPFVGRAGQLLDRAIAEAGLTRAQLYITNTVKCRAADWSSGRPVNRPP
ncbi:MAG: uracil-DNA glycosylase, partial [Chloroflexota bacterium]